MWSFVVFRVVEARPSPLTATPLVFPTRSVKASSRQRSAHLGHGQYTSNIKNSGGILEDSADQACFFGISILFTELARSVCLGRLDTTLECWPKGASLVRVCRDSQRGGRQRCAYKEMIWSRYLTWSEPVSWCFISGLHHAKYKFAKNQCVYTQI